MINYTELTIITKQLQKSDKRALEQIFKIFQKDIFNFLFCKTNDFDLAEDLLQETFIKLWENRYNLDETKSIKAYIFTIANNLSLNYIRHKKIVLHFKNNHAPQIYADENPHRKLEYEEFREILIKTIDKIAEKPRMVFLLSRIEKLSYKEIAERLNIKISTVESHMVKVLRIIREEINKYNH